MKAGSRERKLHYIRNELRGKLSIRKEEIIHRNAESCWFGKKSRYT